MSDQNDYRVKELIMLFLYHLKNLLNFFRNNWSMIFFGISICLFLLILIPNTILNIYPIVGVWPRAYEIEGQVFQVKTINGTIHKVPCQYTDIQIGGFTTKSDSEGKFILKFLSRDNKNIPIIINNKIFRIEYDIREYYLKREFIIYE